MNGRKFVENFIYALERDFTSTSGEPAAWAPGHPKRWGQERAKVRLDGAATTPTLSPDDRFVAVGVDEEVHVFGVATQERLEVLTVGELIETVKFAPGCVETDDGKSTHYVLASQGGDDEKTMVILWELDEDGKLAAKTSHEQEHRLCFEGELGSFGADGKTMIFFSQNETTQEETRGAAFLPCVNLWNIETKSFRHKLLANTDSIMWAAMTPDDKPVASVAWDGTARIWDARSGSCLHILGPFGGQLWSGAFSPDQRYLAISQGDPKSYVHVYNIATEQPVSRFDEFHLAAGCLSWRHDGTMLASGANEGKLCIWDPYTGEEQMRWCLAFDDLLMRRFATTRAVQFVDGGRKLMFQIREGTVEVYDFESNLKQQFTRGMENKVDSCAVSEIVCSRDSKFVVVPDMDRFLRIWDL
ncbi:WD40-repeat-containing domain protein [Aspergillus floccosus]